MLLRATSQIFKPFSQSNHVQLYFEYHQVKTIFIDSTDTITYTIVSYGRRDDDITFIILGIVPCNNRILFREVIENSVYFRIIGACQDGA